MKTIKVSEATNAQLDWLVAKCEGVDEEAFRLFYEPTESTDYDSHGYPEFHYSTIWSQMGPIIEREGICLQSEVRDHSIWKAQLNFTKHIWLRNPMRQVHTYCSMRGSSALIAAARCCVVSKMGDVVEVPEELM